MAALPMALPHPAPYTVYDLLDMPDDGNRYEVIHGGLFVSPAPRGFHNWVADSLRDVLKTAAPKGVRVLTATGVRCGSDGMGRIPDVVVARFDKPREVGILDASQVLAVVEVVSPGSRSRDRSLKPVIYAEAGIPVYWRAELEPFQEQLRSESLPVILVHELQNGRYQLVDRIPAGRIGRTELPFEVAFDPAAFEE